MALRRMWINQPSTLQDDHALNGTRVLVEDQPGRAVDRVWFLDGPIISKEMLRTALSPGWPAHLR